MKDGEKAIGFYRDILGMSVVEANHIPNDFSIYFLACLTEEQRALGPPASLKDKEAVARFRATLWQPVLTLIHNHGTEKDPAFEVGHEAGFVRILGRATELFLPDDANLVWSHFKVTSAGAKNELR